jgi:hypothetical protein
MRRDFGFCGARVSARLLIEPAPQKKTRDEALRD